MRISKILEKILNVSENKCPSCGSKEYKSEYINGGGIENIYKKIIPREFLDVPCNLKILDNTLKYECNICCGVWSI